jgi:prepilin-type N-terminal cleavage/methylation domain-containing protein
MLKRSAQLGLTMIEILAVLAIIGVIIVALMLSLPKQLGRSRDAQRKADLEKVKIAFEDYYNDNGCYPDQTMMQSCGGTAMQPYLQSVPCDPQSKQPYLYIPDLGDTCSGYRILANLEDDQDRVIESLGCSGACGCGWEEGYNYGVSTGVELTGEVCGDYTPSPTPSSSPAGGSPSPSPSSSTIYVYACDPTGSCQVYESGHPDLVKCPTTFPTAMQCGNSGCPQNIRCTN